MARTNCQDYDEGMYRGGRIPTHEEIADQKAKRKNGGAQTQEAQINALYDDNEEERRTYIRGKVRGRRRRERAAAKEAA